MTVYIRLPGNTVFLPRKTLPNRCKLTGSVYESPTVVLQTLHNRPNNSCNNTKRQFIRNQNLYDPNKGDPPWGPLITVSPRIATEQGKQRHLLFYLLSLLLFPPSTAAIAAIAFEKQPILKRIQQATEQTARTLRTNTWHFTRRKHSNGTLPKTKVSSIFNGCRYAIHMISFGCTNSSQRSDSMQTCVNFFNAVTCGGVCLRSGV